MYRNLIKPALDRLIGFFFLILLAPLMTLISILIFISFKSMPLFYQDRPGKSGRIFKLIKFKTMRDIWDRNGNLLPDKDRLTHFGRFIRSLSLDELPQILNVLKGEMSIVGPRPLLKEYLPLYNKQQRRRHDVKPGITGWAQVNGRNALSWEEKFEMDVWYVENITFCLDLKIVCLTLLKILKRENINSSEATTMKPFTGTKSLFLSK